MNRLEIKTSELKNFRLHLRGSSISHSLLSKEMKSEKFDNISEDKIQSLIEKAKIGCLNSRNKILESNLQFVYLSAKKFYSYSNHILNFSDLVSEGTFGIFKAIEKYDPKKGNKFLSYATWYISQTMSEAIYRSTPGLRFSAHVEDKMNLSGYIDEMIVKDDYKKDLNLAEKYAEKSDESDYKILNECFIQELETYLWKFSMREAGILIATHIGGDTCNYVKDFFSISRELTKKIKRGVITKVKKDKQFERIFKEYSGLPLDRKIVEKYLGEGLNGFALEMPIKDITLPKESVERIENIALRNIEQIKTKKIFELSELSLYDEILFKLYGGRFKGIITEIYRPTEEITLNINKTKIKTVFTELEKVRQVIKLK